MIDILINNARILTCKSTGPKCGIEMKDGGLIENGYIAIKDGKIFDINSGSGNEHIDNSKIVIDAKNRLVLPGFVDSHTHLVHYGSRENEYELKQKGVPYLEILANGGGILSTVRHTREATKEQLEEKALKSLDIMLSMGTTTIESKSGYGLNFEDEVKCLEVSRDIKHPIERVQTYLGAHAIPEEYKNDRRKYIDIIIKEVIPYVAKNNLATFIDCFCEKGVFTIAEGREILQCGIEYGLKAKLHADEIESLGGAELAAKVNATSADHLIAASDNGILAMKEANVIPILLPGTSFNLKLNKYARSRFMLDNNLPIALASDYNPGSCPSESLQSMMVFAATGMALTPTEIINAITINGAHAIGLGDTIGSLEKGKQADILIMNALNENYLVYHFGINHVETVIKKGAIVLKNNISRECMTNGNL